MVNINEMIVQQVKGLFMLPILLIHGYSAEGKKNPVHKIYGQLPKLLRKELGSEMVEELNLSRWISLSDGISLDDVSFAMERALRSDYPHLLSSGFHVIIHSTGALVVRNWIKKHSAKPSPIHNIVHLAGANFGSGLAHIGRGQLSRWGRFIFSGIQSGTKVLQELEFGSWKTLDLHCHFLQPNNDIYRDYNVQEFCLIGSQTFSGTLKDVMQLIPIRYVKEDSCDNTVRASSCNLNFNYIPVKPVEKTKQLNAKQLLTLVNKREKNTLVKSSYYQYDLQYLNAARTQIPFGLLYETAHFGADIGIVDGIKNRRHVLPFIKMALKTDRNPVAYQKTAQRFSALTDKTLQRASRLKRGLFSWNKQAQYEGHLQVIFRIRDQFGNPVEYNDITFNSVKESPADSRLCLEHMIEDRHDNDQHKGTTTFYLRVVQHNTKYEQPKWQDLLENLSPLHVEVTAYEPDSNEIAYVPLNIELSSRDLRYILQVYCTTIIDITMVRLPTETVFAIERD